MWTALGYPACAVAIPLLMDGKHLPKYMVARDATAKEGKGLHCEMCDASLKIKNEWAFPLKISNGKRYVALQNILVDNENKPALMTCANDVETEILSDFLPLYQQWNAGKISDKEFWQAYDQVSSEWMKKFYEIFQPYWTNEK